MLPLEDEAAVVQLYADGFDALPRGDKILVLPAWPADWEASFTLRARGAFVVTASRRGGAVEFVEILSEAGAPCHLRNPWGDAEITLQRDGGATERGCGGLAADVVSESARGRPDLSGGHGISRDSACGRPPAATAWLLAGSVRSQVSCAA